MILIYRNASYQTHILFSKDTMVIWSKPFREYFQAHSIDGTEYIRKIEPIQHIQTISHIQTI